MFRKWLRQWLLGSNVSTTKYAILVVSGVVQKYEGEPLGELVPQLDYNPNQKIREADALNLLGAAGYRHYDMEKYRGGQMDYIRYRFIKTW